MPLEVKSDKLGTNVVGKYFWEIMPTNTKTKQNQTTDAGINWQEWLSWVVPKLPLCNSTNISNRVTAEAPKSSLWRTIFILMQQFWPFGIEEKMRGKRKSFYDYTESKRLTNLKGSFLDQNPEYLRNLLKFQFGCEIPWDLNWGSRGEGRWLD